MKQFCIYVDEIQLHWSFNVEKPESHWRILYYIELYKP